MLELPPHLEEAGSPVAAGALSFGANGHLPAGIHDCTLGQLRDLVCTNAHRREMWQRLLEFYAGLGDRRGFTYAYLGGGYVSTRCHPRDIDLILQTRAPYGPDSFASLEPLFRVGLDRLWQDYGVHLHFWMDGAPQSLTDYRVFFQYDRNAGEAPTAPGQVHGLARLALTEFEQALPPASV